MIYRFKIMPMCFLAARLWLEFVAKPETLATIHRAFRPNRLAISIDILEPCCFFFQMVTDFTIKNYTLAVACKTLSQLSSFLKRVRTHGNFMISGGALFATPVYQCRNLLCNICELRLIFQHYAPQ